MTTCKRLTADSPLSWQKVPSARVGTASFGKSVRHFCQGHSTYTWSQFLDIVLHPEQVYSNRYSNMTNTNELFHFVKLVVRQCGQKI